MIVLSAQEKMIFEQWLIENVTAHDVVPPDEGSDDALLFNLVHLVRGDKQKYDYKPEQDAELRVLRYAKSA